MSDKLRKQIRRQIRDHYLELDADARFPNAPTTDDELHEFIDVAFDLRIPRKVVEPGHSAPFDFIADLFFERTKNALAFANRNGGKTISVAILNTLDMLFKPGCEIASAGAVRNQAKKCYSYFQSFLAVPWFRDLQDRYQAITGRPLVSKSIQEETNFDTGAEQQIITATEKGLRSPHPHKARIDEIDEIEWSILQTGLSMARSAKGIKGQNVFTSTRQFEHGSMQKLLNESVAKGIKVYEWNVWETIERCTRRCINDPEHGTCPIYTFCKGKAHHSAGFIEIEDFIDKVKLLDREKFETEWLNKKPSRHKLVYHMFDNTRHVLTPDKLFQMTGVGSPSAYWPRISGLDFGSSPGHPFVYLKLAQLPNNAWLIFYEYVAEQRLMQDHAKAIKASPFWTRSELCYSDHASQERLELKNKGIRTKPAQKDVLTGLDYVGSLLRGFPPAEEPQLYVWHECSFVIKEFAMYCWPTRPDGVPDRSGKPLKRYDHSMDAIRYALFSFRSRPMRKYRTRKVAGI
jgi:hypothetical protein